jgi:hypothetical protein
MIALFEKHPPKLVQLVEVPERNVTLEFIFEMKTWLRVRM